MNISDPRPIGVFDSGVGGLTVLKQLMELLPEERFIYFGDTARLPYGEKSPETIVRYSIENAIFLLEKNIKMLVIACNTASAHALEKLQKLFSVPVIGVIDPGAEHAVQVSAKGRIAVLATKGTIGSQSYQKAILKNKPDAFILPIACPLFVPLVEEHYLEHPATQIIVKEYLQPIEQNPIDTLLLGCTHYPLLKKLIQQVLGDRCKIIDSALACAQKVSAVLHTNSLKSRCGEGREHKYYASDDPQKLQTFGKLFLGMPISQVELVYR